MTTRAEHIETLEAFARVAGEDARATLASIEADIGAPAWSESLRALVEPLRAAVREADRVAAFVARARAGRVDDADLELAAEAARSLLP